MFTFILLLSLLITVYSSLLSLACLPEGTTNSGVWIGRQTWVCLVINDRQITVFAPYADEYSRLMLTGSYSQIRSCSSFWYPLQNGNCFNNRTNKNPVRTGTTNLYIESMGVKSSYKKVYATVNRDFVYPLLTAVIGVRNGIVTSVFWDDGCYFCPASAAEKKYDANQPCRLNSYDLVNNTQIPESTLANTLGGDAGFECGIAKSICENKYNNVTNPDTTFCDLGIYIVWTGTDVNGNYFASAGVRFSRFKQYSLPGLFDTLEMALGGGKRGDIIATKSPTEYPTQAPVRPS